MTGTTATNHRPQAAGWFMAADRRTNERMAKIVGWIITVILAANQLMIISISPKSMAASPLASVKSMLGIQTASAKTIIAPTINPDGKTTSLVEQPTISDVPANPKSGDALADAEVVMLGTDSPPYAPDGVSFADPVTAQNKWGAYETMEMTGELQTRYDTLTNDLPCSYCCGQPGLVTRNRNCACAHAKAARGYFKYMLQTYGAKYTNEQLRGEAFRWQAIWYPKGAVEDYLLATGKVNVIGHAAHGGAGADGLHGLTK
ncbi:MAG: hypothetical protein HYY50_03700 [Candidatus Kerfeldbacteria bacterium]|nr:hypothetical protein [Candidatus Kerfeldbacteria bacterium]